MNGKHNWPRVIILVDMNAFFASVEQLDHPEWQARPVAITNGELGSTIITCSYEARSWGVKTGMRLKEARKLCPELIQAPSRPERYAAISTQIMASLELVTPDIEVFSVDEAFLDVSGCQRLWGEPEDIAYKVKQVVLNASGVLCSVGVSGDKTTAKYAAKLNKPDGLTIIPPWEAESVLEDVPVTELCGVNKGIGRFLVQRGVFTCGDMKKMPASELGKRFGNPGRRIWLMAQGKDPEPLIMDVPPPKSVGHGKVIPPDTHDVEVLLTFFQHMSEKVAARMRKYGLQASIFHIGMRAQEEWLKARSRTAIPTDDGSVIFGLCRSFLTDFYKPQIGIFQIQVTALNPHSALYQVDLFARPDRKKEQLNQAMDAVNERYGEFVLSPARLLNRSEMPNVIAPAWKPYGLRQTI